MRISIVLVSNRHFRIANWFKVGCCLVAFFIIPMGTAIGDPNTNCTRERLLFDSDWHFTKGDPSGIGDELSYANLKAWCLATGNQFVKDGQPVTQPAGNPGGDVAYTWPGYDDHDWQLLDLPHDWAIAGPFRQEYPGSTGRLPFWGVGWYRKRFYIPTSDRNRRLYLDIDGAMSYANVWVNGQYTGGWPYGYSSWELDLTPYIKFGAENIVAIRLDNPPDSSRWYPGAGIYRNVWMLKTSQLHVSQWGTYITTPEISSTTATVKIEVSLANDSDSNSVVSIKNKIYELNADNEKGRFVAEIGADGLQVMAHKTESTGFQTSVKNPKLWDLKKPQRYVVITSIEQNGKILDSYETPFGIRTIKFDANNGFFLNGEHVRINGVCGHADLGALGTAVNVRALERQIQTLKEMGCNAIRTSHNPPAPELLDLCDRLGMLVMDESFDCWEKGKTPNDYHLLFDDWHEKDWRAELRRDRNHPSIILWSIGNEVPDQQRPAGFRIGAELTKIAHEEDPTRPTIAACDHIASGFNGFGTNLDVFGYNYKPFEYAHFHSVNPGQPIIGSETASCISSRGEYFYPVNTNKDDGESDFQISSYDFSAPPWATIPDSEFMGQDTCPFVAGEFVWTGFDYLGEPTPYGKTNDLSRSSYFGIVDLAGFKKDRFYLYQARWRPDLPMAHLVPQCWNWPELIGQTIPVLVYTSGDAAELFLNGKSLGIRKKEQYQYRLRWDNVRYEPGELKVVAYKSGKKWATNVVHTTGLPAKLILQADRDEIRADGKDLSFVTVQVEDKHGLLVPLAKNLIHFDLSGPGKIIATDNGDPTDLTSFQSRDRAAFNGLALAIICSKRSGSITLKASSSGLISCELTIDSHGPNH